MSFAKVEKIGYKWKEGEIVAESKGMDKWINNKCNEGNPLLY